MTSDSTAEPSGSLVERSVLSDQVKDRLLKRIVEGELEPGSRIVETRVAREFGISQAPVREALRSLVSLGLVEMRPHRGAWVRRPDARELVEAVEVRGVLESFAAEQAATRISDGRIQDLEDLLDEMIHHAAEDDALALAHKDAEFHATVIAAAESTMLERTWQMLEPFSQTYLTVTTPGVDLMWVAKRHEPIVDALRAHDSQAAALVMRHHLEQAAEIRRTTGLEGEGTASDR